MDAIGFSEEDIMSGKLKKSGKGEQEREMKEYIKEREQFVQPLMI